LLLSQDTTVVQLQSPPQHRIHHNHLAAAAFRHRKPLEGNLKSCNTHSPPQQLHPHKAFPHLTTISALYSGHFQQMPLESTKVTPLWEYINIILASNINVARAIIIVGSGVIWNGHCGIVDSSVPSKVRIGRVNLFLAHAWHLLGFSCFTNQRRSFLFLWHVKLINAPATRRRRHGRK